MSFHRRPLDPNPRNDSVSPGQLLIRLLVRRLGRWSAVLAVVLVLALAITWFSGASPVPAEAFSPVSDEVILERVPEIAAAEMRHLRIQRQRLAADPENLHLAVDLGWAFLRLREGTGDPRFGGYLQSALAPWWELAEPPHQVLLLRAAERRSAQDLSAAERDLKRYLSLRPESVEGWLEQATLQRIQGDLDSAQASCRIVRHLAEAHPEIELRASACEALADGTANLRNYHQLRRQMHLAPAAAEATRVEVLSALSELAMRRGRVDEAEDALRRGLRLRPTDSDLLARYADLLLDQDRSREVLQLLEKHTTVGGLLVRLAEAEQRLGIADYKDHAAVLEFHFEEARREGSRRHLAHEARFRLRCQRRSWEALRLALTNWERQRRPDDARLVLEAAWLARRPELARPVLGFLDQAGWEEQRLRRLAQQLEEVG
jgi:cytochrome c-type biogenesis protein CcmH/NrfG